MIRGRVVPGLGSVSRRVRGDRLRARQAACGMPIVRGTLNIDVGPLKLLSILGAPSFTCEDDHRLGPLRWWPVLLTFDDDPFLAYYVRHERSRMRHVEVCSDVHFRSIGIETGDLVTVTPVLTLDT